MNISALKQGLNTMAREVDSSGGDIRVDGVFGKIRAARRRRALAAGCSAIVAAAVVAGALWLPGEHKADQQPTKTFRLHAIRDHGIPFYSDPGGNRLVAHRVGNPGQDRVRFSFPVARGALVPVAVCTAEYSKSQPFYVHVVVNGSPAFDAPCTGQRDFSHPEHGLFMNYEEPVTNTLGNIDFGAANFGSTMTVEAWLSKGVRGSITKAPDAAQIGVAIYAHDPDMLKVHNIWVARQIVSNDHTYALAARSFKDLTTSGTATLNLPRSDTRLWFAAGVGQWSSPATVTLPAPYHDHVQVGPISSTMTMAFATPPPSRRTESISISGKVPGSSGFLFLVAYARID